MVKLQSYAVPHNKMKEHLKQAGTKINPVLLPIPQLLQNKQKNQNQPTKQFKKNKTRQKRRFSTYLEVLVSQQVLSGVSAICWGDQSFQCI